MYGTVVPTRYSFYIWQQTCTVLQAIKTLFSKQGKDKISEHKHEYRDQYKQPLSVDGTTPLGHALTVTLAAIGSLEYGGSHPHCARTNDKLPALLWRLKYVLTVKHEVCLLSHELCMNISDMCQTLRSPALLLAMHTVKDYTVTCDLSANHLTKLVHMYVPIQIRLPLSSYPHCPRT